MDHMTEMYKEAEALAASDTALVERPDIDWKRIDDALYSCAGLLKTILRDEIGDTCVAELKYVRSVTTALSQTSDRAEAASRLTAMQEELEAAKADDDETYEIGKRDGYESAIQDLDLATGGDGEFRGSTIPGRTVDVPVMKQRIIDRFNASDRAEAAIVRAGEPVAAQEAFVRDAAVAAVDAIHGYTMEFAPSPAQHRHEYDMAESAIRRELEFAQRRLVSALASPSDREAEAVTDEMVQVPVEPTPEILDAIVRECKIAWGVRADDKRLPANRPAEWREVAKPFYRAMIAASPAQNKGAEQ